MDNKKMTTKEKMLNGIPYIPSEELFTEIVKTKILVEEYNNTSIKDMKKRDELIKTILNVTGERICIHSPFSVDYGKNVTIGNGSFINHNCVILDEGEVIIGDNVRIAPHVGIYTVGHVEEPVARIKGYEYTKKIVIEDNVWIGGGCTILPGVTIGENSIIGGGSVVTKDIPKNVVAYGNPCKVMRNINTDDNDKIE